MHRPPTSNNERTRELDEMERASTRAHRRLLCETLLGCVACCAVGLFFVGWAVHTTNAALGGVSFWTGLLTGDVGTMTILVRSFRCTAEDG